MEKLKLQGFVGFILKQQGLPIVIQLSFQVSFRMEQKHDEHHLISIRVGILHSLSAIDRVKFGLANLQPRFFKNFPLHRLLNCFARHHTSAGQSPVSVIRPSLKQDSACCIFNDSSCGHNDFHG
ncbi:hypothetical protein D3C75_1153780 [compost metagenome]